MGPAQMLEAAYFVALQKEAACSPLEKEAFWGAALNVVKAAPRLLSGAAKHGPKFLSRGFKSMNKAPGAGGFLKGGPLHGPAMPPPTQAQQALQAATGKGSWFWGKPSAEQLARGNRPWTWQKLNPFRPRQYANDVSFARQLGNLTTIGAYGLAGDSVMNTDDRMQRAGELGAATAMYQLSQGTPWERIQRLAGAGFGSPQYVTEALRQKSPGQMADMYAYMRGQGAPIDPKDLRTKINLMLGLGYK